MKRQEYFVSPPLEQTRKGAEREESGLKKGCGRQETRRSKTRGEAWWEAAAAHSLFYFIPSVPRRRRHHGDTITGAASLRRHPLAVPRGAEVGRADTRPGHVGSHQNHHPPYAPCPPGKVRHRFRPILSTLLFSWLVSLLACAFVALLAARYFARICVSSRRI